MNIRKAFLILPVSILAFACGSDDPDPIVEEDVVPVAYYDFEGDSKDGAGDFDGEDNSVVYIENAFRGENSTVVDFDGVGSHINLPSAFDFEKKTISFYLHYSLVGTDGTRIIYSSDHGSIQHGMTVISVIESAGQILLSFNFSNELVTVPLGDGSWYHVAAVLDGKSYKYYLIGNVVGSGTFSNYQHSGNGVEFATVGCSRAYDRFMEGEIDDLKIYDKALTQDQIKELIVGLD